jgi:hypothetical protein
MTATETTKSSYEITDWTLLQYHNKCVARVANWADVCKSVIHLQVDNRSSLLAVVLKVAFFAIVTIGFLLYDVLNEAWRGSFSKNEVSAEPPPKPIEPPKQKAPPPTPKKQTPAVDSTVSAKLDLLDGGLAESLEKADEHTEQLESIASDVDTIKTRVGRLEKSLTEIQKKIDGITKKVIDQITPLINKPIAKQVSFAGASVLPTGTPENWTNPNQTPYFYRGPPLDSSPHTLLSNATFSQPSEIKGLSLSHHSEEEDEAFVTPPISDPNAKETITMSTEHMALLRKALAKSGFVIENLTPYSASKTKHSGNDSTPLLNPKKKNLFEGDISLTPPSLKRLKGAFLTPNLDEKPMEETPNHSKITGPLNASFCKSASKKTPLGVPSVSFNTPVKPKDTD